LREKVEDSNRIESPGDGVLVTGKRRTPLRPAFWMTVSLTWATIVAVLASRSNWPIVFFSALTTLSFVSYLGSYIYLMITDRESLKAEHYSVKTLPSGIPALSAPIAARLGETYRTSPLGIQKHKQSHE
jgi:hypothetical protein